MRGEGIVPTIDLATGNGGNSGNGGFGNGFGDGAWWIVILFLFVFCGWGRNGFDGNGSSGSGAEMNYVLSSDFATLQRLLSDGFNNLNNAVTTVNEGLCNGFYNMNTTLLNGFNTTNTNVMQGNYALQNAVNGVSNSVESCCCKLQSDIANVNYNNAMGFNSIQNSICTSTRDIVDSQTNGTREILNALTNFRIEDKNAQIQAQQNEINALRLASSQAQQNAYLLNELKPCPIPAYITCNPYQSYSLSALYGNNGCGCGNY